MGERQFPFIRLGRKIKKLRESARESLSEVSGAIEIDPSQLVNIEAGKTLPSEDILLLLINHFDLNDKEALQLWELADYEKNDENKLNNIPQNVLLVMPIDNRIIYSDETQVEATKTGVVINFMQPTKTESLPISRIGMSLEQAKSLITQLQHQIVSYKPPKKVQRLLPPTTNKRQNKTD